MKEPWLLPGSSDPLSYICKCPCSTSSSTGQVLLFYRYFAAPPSLPSTQNPLANDPTVLASFHTTLTTTLNLGGKIRIAKEGFNITVGGTKASLDRYIQECMSHWSFAGLEKELDTEEKRSVFFKPSPGCACVFSNALASVRVCSEITPMGVTNYEPRDWDVVQSLSPADFHAKCWEARGKKVLVDVRNYYESRIGYFVDPHTGEGGVRPDVRRFGQWPQFVKHNISALQSQIDADLEKRLEDDDEGKEKGTQYLTYCTGGIRCEKGARFLAENLHGQHVGGTDSVCTLKGGIQAYLMWMDEEIKAGRKTAGESLFKGKNYVFDARGSTGLSEGLEGLPVSQCHICGKLEDRLGKCRSRGCHLILVVCEDCEEGDVRCCPNCLELDRLTTEKRPICACEKEREKRLWGDRSVRLPRTQRKRGGKSSDIGSGINIQIKAID